MEWAPGQQKWRASVWGGKTTAAGKPAAELVGFYASQVRPKQPRSDRVASARCY